MALFILQPGIQPLGQFDFLDTDLASVTGGQFGVWNEAARANSATEKAAADARDGYVADAVSEGTPTTTRAILQLADGSETGVPYYLLDEGTSPHYGTLFGGLIGNPVGLATTGTALGPHSAQGSGKVTAWDKPGLYAVTLDACDADLVPTTTGNLYDTPLPGAAVYRGAATAQLTRVSTTGYMVGCFIELRGNGSLVTTPASLVGTAETPDRAVINFYGSSFAIDHDG